MVIGSMGQFTDPYKWGIPWGYNPLILTFDPNSLPYLPSKIEWERIPTDPGPSKLRSSYEILRFFSGSVKRGSCWRFLGKYQEMPRSTADVYILLKRWLLFGCHVSLPEGTFTHAGFLEFLYNMLENTRGSHTIVVGDSLKWQTHNGYKLVVNMILEQLRIGQRFSDLELLGT